MFLIEDARQPEAYDVEVDFWFDWGGAMETVTLAYKLDEQVAKE